MAFRPIGTEGNIPTLTVGGVTFTDLDNLIVVQGQASSNSNSTCRLPNSTSGYQAVNTFRVRAAKMRCGNSTAGQYANISPLYSDNDVGLNSATAFTSAVSYAGSGNNFFTAGSDGVSADHTRTLEHALFFNVLTTKYFGFAKSGLTNDTGVQAFGYDSA
jgi:hypothetical protein